MYILFKNTNSADMLRLAAPSVLFICIMQLGGAVLQSVGHIGRAFAASAAAAVIKIIFTVILVPIPGINIYGAVIGSDIGALAGAVINLVNISRYTGLKREYNGDNYNTGSGGSGRACRARSGEDDIRRIGEHFFPNGCGRRGGSACVCSGVLYLRRHEKYPIGLEFLVHI